jgi:hypothetical protein
MAAIRRRVWVDQPLQGKDFGGGCKQRIRRGRPRIGKQATPKKNAFALIAVHSMGRNAV